MSKSKNFIILLSGSSGFLGSALKDDLEKKGYNVQSVKIRNKNDVAQIGQQIETSNFKYKIINAGWGNVKDNSFDKQLQFENLDLQKHFLSLANIPSVVQFVNFGSYNEYGNSTGILSEEKKDNSPISEYAKAKNEIRIYIEKQNFSNKCLHLRISNIYGPSMKINTLYGTLVNYLSSNQNLKFGACNSKRDMLYISDFCHSIELILKQIIPLSGILNIGSGHTRSNKDFVLDFARKNNIPESVINFDESKIENNIMSEDYSLSIQKAKKILNWTPRNS